MDDAGDELVCPGCGVVKEKAVVEAGPGGSPSIFGKQPLGSYMGTKWTTGAERASPGLSGSRSGYAYLKVVSDFAGKERGARVECAKLIERVAEKLGLPRVAALQAAAVSRRIFASFPRGRRLSVAEVSAYSLVAACRLEGVMTVSIREILGAYSMMGRGVTSSSIFRLALESPVGMYAKGPGAYVPRVLARLSQSRALSCRLSKEGVARAAYLASLRRVALDLLERCDPVAMEGKRPCALAASAVYSAEAALSVLESRKNRLTQKDLAGCGDTSEYTIREQCATIFRRPLARLGSSERQTPLPQVSC